MRCKRAREFISLGLDDAIGEFDRSQLAEHLQGCSDCTKHEQVLQAGRELLRAGTAREPSENFEWKVQLGIQRALRERASQPVERPSSRRMWLGVGGTAVAVASAVVLVGLSWLGSPNSSALRTPDLEGARSIPIRTSPVAPPGSGSQIRAGRDASGRSVVPTPVGMASDEALELRRQLRYVSEALVRSYLENELLNGELEPEHSVVASDSGAVAPR